MTLEDNKNVIRKFFKAFEAQDLEELERLAGDDFSWWVAPTTVSSGTYNKAAWLPLIEATFEQVDGPIKLELGDLTAEDDRVSVTMVGHVPFKGGKLYNSHYHLLFQVRDGKIGPVKEYLDTYHVGEIFGFPNAAA
jgi:ketosteroid isomerase-like protein